VSKRTPGLCGDAVQLSSAHIRYSQPLRYTKTFRAYLRLKILQDVLTISILQLNTTNLLTFTIYGLKSPKLETLREDMSNKRAIELSTIDSIAPFVAFISPSSN